MWRSSCVVLSLVLGVSTATADVTFTLKDGEKLTVAAEGWIQDTPNTANLYLPKRLIIGVLLQSNTCDGWMKAIADGKPAAKVIALPEWAPRSWNSKAVSIPESGVTTIGVCKSYKSKSLFVGLGFSGDTLGNFIQQGQAKDILAEIDAATGGGPKASAPTGPTTLKFELANNKTLNVTTSNPWTLLKPELASIGTKDGSLGIGLMFYELTCPVVMERSLGATKTTSAPYPSWAPSSWGSKATRMVDGNLTVVNVCRPYAGGALLIVMQFYDKTPTSAIAEIVVRELLAALDRAAGGTPAPQPDAVTEASEEGTSITLKDPDLMITVPTGYRLAGQWITKSGDVDRDGVRIEIYPTDVDCKTGMVARDDEMLEAAPVGTPIGFYERVAFRSGSKGVTYTLCSDVTGGVMTAEVDMPQRGALLPDHAKILASATRVAHGPTRKSPEQLKFTFTDLGGRTFEIPAKAGGWSHFPFLSFSLSYVWPRPNKVMVTMLDAKSCTATGTHELIPSPWRATTQIGSVKGCLEVGGTVYEIGIVVNTYKLTPADRARVAETVHALATTIYPQTAPYVAAAQPAVATVEPTTSTTTSSSSGSSSYTPSYRSDDSSGRPLRTYLYGASIAGHMFVVDGRDDTYGFSVGYARSLAPKLRLQLEGGYNGESGWLFDGRVELGSYLGEREAGIGLWGMLGVDGLGLGREDDPMADPTMVAPRIEADLYYGPRFEIVMSSIYAGIGYAWRNADAVDHTWRFDLGYRLESGHDLGFRYTGYGDAGHYLSLYYRY